MSNTHKGCCCHGSGDTNHEDQHSCGGCHGGHHQTEIQVSDEEIEFLKELAQTPYLPLARFVLKSSKSSHLESVALAPVYLHDIDDSMETVKSMAAVLEALESKGLITLDYEEPLENGNYEDYSGSSLYAYFKETVAQAQGNDDFLFDIPNLEFGSIALTYLGQAAVESLDEQEDLLN
ncbi:hypothetical protein Ami103574_10205 [Aminipila butyrica]|uniref:Uncharacterized protein n=1 Tax=Aminipila butyrica TaxID=433296 RepID=A0A858BUF1_9FIRM|nr:Abi-alpha family protein [Aminipila butyrica]QIB69671.1 hypothetical protein Ami103574_10205 [Aminipila butyrica]